MWKTKDFEPFFAKNEKNPRKILPNKILKIEYTSTIFSKILTLNFFASIFSNCFPIYLSSRICCRHYDLYLFLVKRSKKWRKYFYHFSSSIFCRKTKNSSITKNKILFLLRPIDFFPSQSFKKLLFKITFLFVKWL